MQQMWLCTAVIPTLKRQRQAEICCATILTTKHIPSPSKVNLYHTLPLYLGDLETLGLPPELGYVWGVFGRQGSCQREISGERETILH